MKCHSRYPIGKAVIDLLNGSGLSLDEFVRQLGYRKASKGKAEFRFLINHGLCELKFREALKELISDRISLELAWQRTAEIRRAEDEEELMRLEKHERNTFRPYLLPLYSFSASSHSSASKRWNECSSKPVELPPEFLTASDERRLALVKTVIQNHNRRGESTLNSHRLSGYILFSEYDGDAYYFSASGDPTESAESEDDEPTISLDDLTLARIDRGDFDEK